MGNFGNFGEKREKEVKGKRELENLAPPEFERSLFPKSVNYTFSLFFFPENNC
jgi:hypothetical protein